MVDYRIGADLPLDVSSRVEGLLSIVTEIGGRVRGYPVLSELLRDFQEMTREYILLFESSLMAAKDMGQKDKWLRRHEMLDKLTAEWHLIYSLASAIELGNSFLDRFKPYVDQAVEDIGLAESGDNFLLIPIFGEKFSLVTVGYSSSNIVILNLPISVIHSPWEFSVIWHELAGLKVIKIRDQITEFLQTYARENNLLLPEVQPLPGSSLFKELFDRIVNEKRLDKDFKLKIKEFLTVGAGTELRQVDIWSQDWFEQLYEDACSVFAFGESFVSVLEKILGRQAGKLTADRKHPDLATRLQVARRLLALHKGGAPAPATDAERLTDSLLWAFINQKRPDPAARLPVAHSDPAEVPEIRRKLIDDMQVFNENFGDLAGGTINEKPFDFSPMFDFARKASQGSAEYISNEDRNVRVRERLLMRFKDAGLEDLLNIPFSPSDEVDIRDHNHNLSSSHDTMSINVHNQDHTIWWFGVSHV